MYIHKCLAAAGMALETDWQIIRFQIPMHIKLFVFHAVRGGVDISTDEGDICIDDIYVYRGMCRT